MTLYNSKSPSELIAQAGRSVTTFPSGLVRVDQTFLTESSALFTSRDAVEVGNHAPGGDSSPCIDGLKIFPSAQERQREDGFTEFLVSSYGRSNLVGSAVLGVQLISLAASYTHTYTPPATQENPNPAAVNYSWAIKEDWLVDNWTLTRTILAAEPNSAISITPPTLNKILKKREISGNRPGMNIPGFFGIPGLNSIASEWETVLASIDRRNFGHVDEIVLVFQLSGTVPASVPV